MEAERRAGIGSGKEVTASSSADTQILHFLYIVLRKQDIPEADPRYDAHERQPAGNHKRKTTCWRTNTESATTEASFPPSLPAKPQDNERIQLVYILYRTHL